MTLFTSITLFTFTVYYVSGNLDSCPGFSPPQNGHMICDHLLGKYCTPSCNIGYQPESVPAWAYVCNPVTKRWATYPESYPLPWPDCISKNKISSRERFILKNVFNPMKNETARRQLSDILLQNNQAPLKRDHDIHAQNNKSTDNKPKSSPPAESSPTSDIKSVTSILQKSTPDTLSYSVTERHENNRTMKSEIDMSNITNTNINGNEEVDLENITITTTRNKVPLSETHDIHNTINDNHDSTHVQKKDKHENNNEPFLKRLRPLSLTVKAFKKQYVQYMNDNPNAFNSSNFTDFLNQEVYNATKLGEAAFNNSVMEIWGEYYKNFYETYAQDTINKQKLSNTTNTADITAQRDGGIATNTQASVTNTTTTTLDNPITSTSETTSTYPTSTSTSTTTSTNPSTTSTSPATSTNPTTTTTSANPTITTTSINPLSVSASSDFSSPSLGNTNSQYSPVNKSSDESSTYKVTEKPLGVVVVVVGDTNKTESTVNSMLKSDKLLLPQADDSDEDDTSEAFSKILQKKMKNKNLDPSGNSTVINININNINIDGPDDKNKLENKAVALEDNNDENNDDNTDENLAEENKLKVGDESSDDLSHRLKDKKLRKKEKRKKNERAQERARKLKASKDEKEEATEDNTTTTTTMASTSSTTPTSTSTSTSTRGPEEVEGNPESVKKYGSIIADALAESKAGRLRHKSGNVRTFIKEAGLIKEVPNVTANFIMSQNGGPPLVPVFSDKDLSLLRHMVDEPIGNPNTKRSELRRGISSLWTKMLRLSSNRDGHPLQALKLGSRKQLAKKDSTLAQLIMSDVNGNSAYQFTQTKNPFLNGQISSDSIKSSKYKEANPSARQYVWNGATYVPASGGPLSYLNNDNGGGLSVKSRYRWNGATYVPNEGYIEEKSDSASASASATSRSPSETKLIDKPVAELIKPAEDLSKPLDNLVKPPENIVKVPENVIKPPENVIKPSENNNKPPDNIVKPEDTSLFNPQQDSKVFTDNVSNKEAQNVLSSWNEPPEQVVNRNNAPEKTPEWKVPTAEGLDNTDENMKYFFWDGNKYLQVTKSTSPYIAPKEIIYRLTPNGMQPINFNGSSQSGVAEISNVFIPPTEKPPGENTLLFSPQFIETTLPTLPPFGETTSQTTYPPPIEETSLPDPLTSRWDGTKFVSVKDNKNDAIENKHEGGVLTTLSPHLENILQTNYPQKPPDLNEIKDMNDKMVAGDPLTTHKPFPETDNLADIFKAPVKFPTKFSVAFSLENHHENNSQEVHSPSNTTETLSNTSTHHDNAPITTTPMPISSEISTTIYTSTPPTESTSTLSTVTPVPISTQESTSTLTATPLPYTTSAPFAYTTTIETTILQTNYTTMITPPPNPYTPVLPQSTTYQYEQNKTNSNQIHNTTVDKTTAYLENLLRINPNPKDPYKEDDENLEGVLESDLNLKQAIESFAKIYENSSDSTPVNIPITHEGHMSDVRLLSQSASGSFNPTRNPKIEQELTNDLNKAPDLASAQKDMEAADKLLQKEQKGQPFSVPTAVVKTNEEAAKSDQLKALMQGNTQSKSNDVKPSDLVKALEKSIADSQVSYSKPKTNSQVISETAVSFSNTTTLGRTNKSDDTNFLTNLNDNTKNVLEETLQNDILKLESGKLGDDADADLLTLATTTTGSPTDPDDEPLSVADIRALLQLTKLAEKESTSKKHGLAYPRITRERALRLLRKPSIKRLVRILVRKRLSPRIVNLLKQHRMMELKQKLLSSLSKKMIDKKRNEALKKLVTIWNKKYQYLRARNNSYSSASTNEVKVNALPKFGK